jgi:hypothetical protein
MLQQANSAQLRGEPISTPNGHAREIALSPRHPEAPRQAGNQSMPCARPGMDCGNSTSFRLERVKGIEPSYAAWEAAVLPLNYTRVITSF